MATYLTVETNERIVTGFKITKDKKFFDLVVSFDVDPQKVYYILYVEYTTGDSFGRSPGNLEYIGMYETGEEASEIAKKIEDHYKKYTNKELKDGEYHSVDLGNGRSVYASWTGYFEHLDDIRIASVGRQYTYNYQG